MNTAAYLHRIKYSGTPRTDLNTLLTLHEAHVYSIPFENLDVQYNTDINLEPSHLFQKVVVNHRGGFCYELNSLFADLLRDIGFDVSLISARTIDEGEVGPEFDHMALMISLNGKNWLADVGFGDLFVRPLRIENEAEQFDGRNYFKVQKRAKETYLLTMSRNGTQYEKKYRFTSVGRTIEDFSEQCAFKQYADTSYFVKNKVVTLPVAKGRKTIFNSKYIFKSHGTKTEYPIHTEKEERMLLKKEFNIELKTLVNPG